MIMLKMMMVVCLECTATDKTLFIWIVQQIQVSHLLNPVVEVAEVVEQGVDRISNIIKVQRRAEMNASSSVVDGGALNKLIRLECVFCSRCSLYCRCGNTHY